MADLKAIRKRISSVKSTQQITRAMKMVAASKLRRAQDKITSARPYAEKMGEMVRNLAVRAGDDVKHPLLESREVKRVCLILVTSDRGLCGAFNTNMIKAAEKYIAEVREKEHELSLITIGRKGTDYFTKKKYDIKEKYPDISSANDYETAQKVTSMLIESYSEEEFDQVTVIFSEFFSAMKQRAQVLQVLPVSTADKDEEEQPDGELPTEYIFEPPAAELLGELLPKSVEIQVFRAILDNLASEFGARMTAMENATNNAGDMIKDLTLTFNKARQEAITKELLDIVGGAEAATN